ncbi:B2 bradykinin receptor-like [Embiotoca jacksoni]|uniref:B2 bradykinin receptor-like n=1 Tax=Embiotoca jacksoni TaxID=100190 RepID=UPI0037047B8E
MDMYGNQTTTPNSTCLIYSDSWSFTVVPVYILVISVLGIIFNVFVLMVFYIHKNTWSVAEIYLSNLAAADLILVSCLPFWAQNVAKKFDWPFGTSLCKLVNLCITMNVYCSIYFLVLVSIDRYLALVHPLRFERLRSTTYAKVGCFLVWGFGLLMNIPVLIFRELLKNKYNITACLLNYSNITEYNAVEGINIVFSFIIPICIISVCTQKIIRALGNRLTEGFNTRKKEQKATILVLVVLIAFLICWIPYHLLKILEVLKNNDILTGCPFKTSLYKSQMIFTYFAFFNSVLNPLLYVIVGKNFQNKVKELFQQQNKKRTATTSQAYARTNVTRVAQN